MLVKKEKNDLLGCIGFLDTDITKYTVLKQKRRKTLHYLLKPMLFEKAKQGRKRISCSSWCCIRKLINWLKGSGVVILLFWFLVF